jgi:carboxymethylenebutenolidase
MDAFREAVMGEWIEINGADGAFKAYVAKPDGAPKGAVVVIQEIFGVNAGIRGKADWLARAGFLAIAPDLFWRIQPGIDITDKTEAEWAQAFGYFKAFDVEKGVVDIQATLDAVRGQSGTGKVGAIGYCLGGLLAYLTGCRTNADASVGYYGVSIETRLGEAAHAKQPVMLHIAQKDAFVPAAAQEAIVAGLGAHPGFTVHLYAEQDHAFTREGGQHYDAEAAKLADARTVAFLGQNLT